MRNWTRGKSPRGSPPEATSKENIAQQPTEIEIQKSIVAYLEEKCISPFTATCGGVYSSRTQRAKIKLLGYRKGVPDLLVFVPNTKYHGLCIEVKSKKGRITEDQRRWHDTLERRGYFVCVPRSFEEAKKFIDEYIQYGS